MSMSTTTIDQSLVLESLPNELAVAMRIVVLTSQRVFLGRAGTGAGRAHIEIPSPTVATRHAELWFDSGSWFIRDTESPSGIYINDEHIGFVGSARLSVGNTVRLGGTTFVVETRRPAEPPTLSVLPHIER